MKPRNHILKYLLAMLLLMAVVGQQPLSAAPPSQKAKLEIQPSVFNVPTSASEGRDPFFPASTRVFATSETQTRGPALTDLTLKSILGTSPHVFAIINNHTFATGDDGDVTTKSGQRLHIRCVDINLKAGTATVEADNASEVLHLTGAP